MKTSRRRGRLPRLTDAELVTLAAAEVMLGSHCEARRLRIAHAYLHGLFPYLLQRPACNKRLRSALGLVKRAIRSLAADTDLWLDRCGSWTPPRRMRRSRETVKRSDLAGWANYGYCRSHSRVYWGLKLHLVCTPASLPVTWALADPKLDERQVLAALIDNEPHLAADRLDLLILTDKGCIAGRGFVREQVRSVVSARAS